MEPLSFSKDYVLLLVGFYPNNGSGSYVAIGFPSNHIKNDSFKLFSNIALSHWNLNSKLNTKLRLEFQVESRFKLEFQVE